MGNQSEVNHGQALHRFLEQEWAALGVTRGAWCRSNGISDSTMVRWQQGTDPDYRLMRQVADALDRSMLEILIAGKYIRPEEVDGLGVPPRQQVSVSEAIRLDPSLTDEARDALRLLLKAFQAVESGRAKKVTVSNTRSHRR